MRPGKRFIPIVSGMALIALSSPLAAQSVVDVSYHASAVLPARTSVDLPRQEAEKNRTKGAVWGGAIGLVAGGILGGVSVDSDSGDSGLTESAATGEAVVLGAVLGAGIGALLGATLFAPDRPSSERAFSVAPLVGIHAAGVVVRLR